MNLFGLLLRRRVGGYCQYRTTLENAVAAGLNPRDLPGEGICVMSQGKNGQCMFPGLSSDECPQAEHLDLCCLDYAYHSVEEQG